jgi:hypothetical protein
MILEPVFGVSKAIAMWCWRLVGIWYGSIFEYVVVLMARMVPPVQCLVC